MEILARLVTMELHSLLDYRIFLGLVSFARARYGHSHRLHKLPNLGSFSLAFILGYLPLFTIFISMPGPLCSQNPQQRVSLRDCDRVLDHHPNNIFSHLERSHSTLCSSPHALDVLKRSPPDFLFTSGKEYRRHKRSRLDLKPSVRTAVSNKPALVRWQRISTH